MKDFVKMTLAVVCGLFIMGIIGFFLFFSMIGAVASLGSSAPVMPRDGVLLMDMSKVALAEQTTEADPMQVIQGNATQTIGLWDAVKAIKSAESDPAIKYIFLKSDGLMAGLAQTEELRQALAEFRKSGKAVISYIENPTTGSYYLASVADKVYMGNYKVGNNMMTGVGTQLIFLKDLLDKLGVNVQLIRHGKYKSAGEMFVKNKASDENLEQNTEMVQSIWKNLAEKICESREITMEQLDKTIDNLELNTPADFLSHSLVDELLTKEELKSQLTNLAVKESFSNVNFISLPDYITVLSTVKPSSKDKIAIIFAEGEIVDGYEKQQVAGDRFASIIANVRADSTVKAVVLRVASPGGSVLASEKIKTEIDLLRKDKPVIASYGDYAASGGYWISNSCDKIFSDPSTLTGSIGVFSMIPEFGTTTKKLFHVNVTTVGSHKHSDMYSLMRPFDARENAYMQESVDNIYEAFIQNVSEGRDMPAEKVDEIAQGRVWTGSDAIKIGLVDEIGTLYDAVRYAAASAGNPETESWNIDTYPSPQTTLEMVMEMFSTTTEDVVLAGTPFESIGKVYKDWSRHANAEIFARMPYVMTIR